MGPQLVGFAGEIKSQYRGFLQQVLIHALGCSRCLSLCLLLAACCLNGIITWEFALPISYCSQQACPLSDMGSWTGDWVKCRASHGTSNPQPSLTPMLLSYEKTMSSSEWLSCLNPAIIGNMVWKCLPRTSA